MYIYRQKILNLCIDLKSFKEDRLRTHVQNADLSDFLIFYLTTSLSAPWMRVLLHAYEHTHTHTNAHTHTNTSTQIHARNRRHTYKKAQNDTHTVGLSFSFFLSRC